MPVDPKGTIKNAIDWGAPFVFRGPSGEDFLEAGLELAEKLKIGSRESDGKLLRRASGESVSGTARNRPEGYGDAGRKQAANAAATSGYWLASWPSRSALPSLAIHRPLFPPYNNCDDSHPVDRRAGVLGRLGLPLHVSRAA
jgi:hypothetical protein